jgi:hypothetical protein
MQNLINLVQGDTGPNITLVLYDATTGIPVDFSATGSSVKMHVREEEQSGTPAVTTITGIKANGGADGVVTFVWPYGSLSNVGYYEGEVEITLASGTTETVPDKLRFYVREQIA